MLIYIKGICHTGNEIMKNTFPFKVLCSTKFGRYAKISIEQVFNMYQADGWMVCFPGHIKTLSWEVEGNGRGHFYSSRSNSMFTAVGKSVFRTTFSNNVPSKQKIGEIGTNAGDVFIAENLQAQIIFCDKSFLYLYDYSSKVFERLNIDFFAGYIIYQDGRFVATINTDDAFLNTYRTPGWRLSDLSLLVIVSATPVNGGTGYSINDELTVLNKPSGSTGKVKVTAIGGSGEVTSVNVVSSGSGYGNNATYPVSGGTGTEATFSVVTSNNPASGASYTGGFAPATKQVGSFQSKSDNVVACVRFPSKTGQLLIMGRVTTEVHTNLGLKLFPYQRNSSYLIDYGCINPATITAIDDFVVWLGSNEKSGPVIMYCDGGSVKQISTDGINYRLPKLKNPEDSFAYIYKDAGHTFYQITFPTDNVTYTYDFNVGKFYTRTDSKQNCHIGKDVAYCNNKYYFISYNDNNLYEMSSDYTTYDGEVIPRIIIGETSGLADRSPFIVQNITFPIEQGHTEESQSISLSCSSDGGVMFGSPKRYDLNALGDRRNKFTAYNLGRYNEITPQLRLWGKDRFLLTNGVVTTV